MDSCSESSSDEFLPSKSGSECVSSVDQQQSSDELDASKNNEKADNSGESHTERQKRLEELFEKEFLSPGPSSSQSATGSGTVLSNVLKKSKEDDSFPGGSNQIEKQSKSESGENNDKTEKHRGTSKVAFLKQITLKPFDISKTMTKDEALRNINAGAETKGSGSKRQNNMKLGDAISVLSKKPKVSVLQNARHDWGTFIKENGIQEELSGHNRGKQGYIGRVEFLQQIDLKQFELEKEARNKLRKK